MTKKNRERDTQSIVEETVTETVEAAIDAPPVVVDTSDHITVEKFLRSVRNKDLAGAFLHCEKLRSTVRKMPQAEWQATYDAWLAAPRG
jgi:hypothetical protein